MHEKFIYIKMHILAYIYIYIYSLKIIVDLHTVKNKTKQYREIQCSLSWFPFKVKSYIAVVK